MFFSGLQAQLECRVYQQHPLGSHSPQETASVCHQAQSFVTDFTGLLQSVEIWLSNGGGLASKATMEIRTTTIGGEPSNIVLGRVTVPMLPASGMFQQKFDFSDLAIRLDKGETYVFVVSSQPSANVSDLLLWYNFSSPNPYVKGSRYVSCNSGAPPWTPYSELDAPFIITMCDFMVPTLSQWGLIILGVLLSLFAVVALRNRKVALVE